MKTEHEYEIYNSPKRIFLCIGEFNYDVDFRDLEQVTWSTERIGDNDIEYFSISDRDKFAMEFAEWLKLNDDGRTPTSQLLDLFKQSKQEKR